MKIRIQLGLLIFSSLALSMLVSGQTVPTETVTFLNTGKMSIGRYADEKASLYVPNSMEMKGAEVEIRQDGIAELDGNFLNNVTANNVFDASSTGWFRFKGTTLQSIQGTANRGESYIAFPNMEVFNSGGVELDHLMGMNVKDLNLAKGKLILRSKAVDGVENESYLAHMQVEGNITYNREATAIADKGVVEVELDLTTQGGRSRHFFSFSSPYKKMYADYFAFNYLLKPDYYFGKSGVPSQKTIIDPWHPLRSGEAYLVGQDVFGEENLTKDDPYKDSEYTDRVDQFLRLNRWSMEGSSINVAPRYVEDAYVEELNTGDVTIHLENQPKYYENYIGNPFTAPLDVTSLLNETSSMDPQENPWQITRGGSGKLRPFVQILNGGTLTKVVDVDKKEFSVLANWLVAQNVGGTYTLEGANTAPILIEPLQIFRVQALESTMVIPASMQRHGTGTMLRGALPVVDDELLLQVVDEDTKAYDRMCIVFRENGSLSSKDEYDVEKVFNYTGGTTQLYTPSSDGKNMTVNVIPQTTTSLAFNVSPCAETKEVELTAHRLQSLHSPQAVCLEDLRTGVITDLTQEASYRFTTYPGDDADRFVLHFQKATTGIDQQDRLPLRAVYHNHTITVSGLGAPDEGATLFVSDLQGRVVLKTSIDAQSSHFDVPFSGTQGVYIVNVSGKRTITTKIVTTD